MDTKVGVNISPIVSSFRLAKLSIGLAFWLCIPDISAAQEPENFRHLIFEPAVVPEGAPQSAVASVLEPTQASDEAGQENAEGASTASVPAATEDAGEQPGGNSNLQNEIGRYEDALDESLQSQDQYSLQLREQYEALGELLQQNNEHERAITMFENAMQIDRVNNGLFTNLQIPLVRQIIESQNALGNREEVDDMHGYLYYIHQKAFAPESAEFLAAKEEWADWNVNSYIQEGGNGLTGNYRLFGALNSASAAYDFVPIQNTVTGGYTYIRREHLPNVLNPSLGIGTNRSTTDLYMQSAPYAVSPEQMVDERLRTAEDLYEEILETRTTLDTETGNAEVQHKLANIAYAVKRQMDVLESQMVENSLSLTRTLDQGQPNIVVSRGYTKNLKAFETIAQELEDSASASPLEKATAYINLGDWNVSYDRAQRSEIAYTKAWQILRDANFADATIKSIMFPQPLVPVPAYVTHEFSREFYNFSAEDTLEYKGYVDTTVDLDRFGRVGNIRIDATSPDTPRRVRDTLFTYLREKKMRPVVENGELVKVSDIKTRYYYSY